MEREAGSGFAGARMTDRILRVGAGSAWWGYSIAPAQALAEQGRLDYLCFETMAEVTVSAAQVRRRRDPGFAGFRSLRSSY